MAYNLYHVQMANAWTEVRPVTLRAPRVSSDAPPRTVRSKNAPPPHPFSLECSERPLRPSPVPSEQRVNKEAAIAERFWSERLDRANVATAAAADDDDAASVAASDASVATDASAATRRSRGSRAPSASRSARSNATERLRSRLSALEDQLEAERAARLRAEDALAKRSPGSARLCASNLKAIAE